MASVIQELRNLFADTGKPAEVNADGEFDTKTFNRFVAQQGIAVRFKQGRQDLATIDAAMNNYKKMLTQMMQQKHRQVDAAYTASHQGTQANDARGAYG